MVASAHSCFGSRRASRTEPSPNPRRKNPALSQTQPDDPGNTRREGSIGPKLPERCRARAGKHIGGCARPDCLLPGRRVARSLRRHEPTFVMDRSHCHRGFDGRVRVVAGQFKILELEFVDVVHRLVQFHSWQRTRFAREL